MSERLPSSKLGTKSHWDKVYERELQTFNDIGEEGEVWFGEETLEKMVDWALDNVPPATAKELYILEVGSGNGTLLFGLAEAGYPHEQMTGIDYSADAVNLARAIAESRQFAGITFQQSDFLHDDLLAEQWDLILDKGTFDAISLSEGDQKPAPEDLYATRLAKCLKPGGLFLITSCNFIEEELKSRFTDPSVGLKYHSNIKHPSFVFGGQEGTRYASVAFSK